MKITRFCLYFLWRRGPPSGG